MVMVWNIWIIFHILGIIIPTFIPTGWWFGTFGLFFHIGNFIIPTDELIFFKMVKTTNQPMIHGDLMGLVLVMNGDEW